MTSESVFIVLFSIATAVALMVRRSRVPYTVALVVVGLVLGGLRVIEPPHLTKELLFTVFLPGLLFEAAFNLDARQFWTNRLAISSLAIPGVVVAIVLTGLMVTPVLRALELELAFTFEYGLVFGALVAATDPIAVVGLFRTLNAPPRLATLIEGESLLNDGTAIVLLTLLLSYVGGSATSVGPLTIQFVTIVGGGAIVGGVIGFGASRVTSHVDDAMIEITITTIAAYSAFVIGEQLHFSGVIATVAAGMVCGNYGREIGMSASTRIAVDTFWEYVAFALNSIIFLLIGFEVRLSALIGSWRQILIAYVAVLIARAGVMALVAALLRMTRERIPMSWSWVLTWGGMRGALSMVLALGLVAGFPHRDLLVTMTYGVVILSLLAQGLTMPWLLRWFGLASRENAGTTYDIARGQVTIADIGLREIDQLASRHAGPPQLLESLRERYRRRREQWREQLERLHIREHQLAKEAAERTVRHLLQVERSAIITRWHEGLLRRDAYEQLVASVDERLDRLESGKYSDLTDLALGSDETDSGQP